MNVYDFDKTIYYGDSSVDFYMYCLRRHPSIAVLWPAMLWAAFLYGIKRVNKTEMKQRFFSFLKRLQDSENLVNEFWQKNETQICKWYINQKKESDVIISASPEFLLKPVCNKLGIDKVIASRVDIFSGKFEGLNCYGEEKVRRFQQQFGTAEIKNFYSDSLSDIPIARLAENGYLVKNHSEHSADFSNMGVEQV